MSGNELTLVNLINNMRAQTGLTDLSPSAVNVGVAKHHAYDMAKHRALSLVASDGEDPFRRITCSGGVKNAATGIVAVGPGSDTYEVFQAIQSDLGAFSTLYNPAYSLSLSVGYRDGYWMIIIQ